MSGTDRCAACLYTPAGDASRPSSSTIAASATAAGNPTTSTRRYRVEAWRAAIAYARALPGGGHFDIHDGPEHEAVVSDEVDFLRRDLHPSI